MSNIYLDTYIRRGIFRQIDSLLASHTFSIDEKRRVRL